MRPLDQPMVKTVSVFLRCLLWKQIYEGYSLPTPAKKQAGEMDKLNFCIHVEKMAIQLVSLKVMAKYRPFGSQTTDCGCPPTSRFSTEILLKSAIDKACLGDEPSKERGKLLLRKQITYI